MNISLDPTSFVQEPILARHPREGEHFNKNTALTFNSARQGAIEFFRVWAFRRLLVPGKSPFLSGMSAL